MQGTIVLDCFTLFKDISNTHQAILREKRKISDGIRHSPKPRAIDIRHAMVFIVDHVDKLLLSLCKLLSVNPTVHDRVMLLRPHLTQHTLKVTQGLTPVTKKDIVTNNLVMVHTDSLKRISTHLVDRQSATGSDRGIPRDSSHLRVVLNVCNVTISDDSPAHRGTLVDPTKSITPSFFLHPFKHICPVRIIR